MAVRPVAVLSLLTFALVAGCSDGPPSGELVPLPAGIDVNGSTAENTYVAESGGTDNPDPTPGNRLCPPEDAPTGEVIPPCVFASSHYKIHFMTLPEPSGEGYKVFFMGGSIGERSLCNLQREGAMWGCEITNDGEDQSSQFERFELRMEDFIVATAASAGGSQAFVANTAVAGVTVTGSYSGKTLTIEVQGLPEGSQYVGRLYPLGVSGNLSAAAESFTVVPGAQEFTSEVGNIADYAQFSITVGESKIDVYRASLE